MVQYLVYLLLLMTDLIHVIRPLYYERPHKNKFDIINTTLHIIFDFFAFFLPYLMAVRCNKAHKDYYNALLDIYQLCHYTNDSLMGCCTRFKQWCKKSEKGSCCCYSLKNNGIPLSDTAAEREPLLNNGNGYIIVSIHQDQPSLIILEDYDNEFKKEEKTTEYSPSAEDKYYARSLWKKIEKRDQFDFCPSFLGISVPISSPGYTFSVVLAFIAILFNFTTLE